jgi:glycerol-3-phosphate dehydrogenase (NAD(P)+)
MNITVLGCGRWGSFLAYYARSLGHTVTLWGRQGSERLSELMVKRSNSLLELQSDVLLTSDLGSAIERASLIIISIAAQELRSFLCADRTSFRLNVPMVLCMKGLEADSGKRLTTVVAEAVSAVLPTVVLVGPGHVQDFIGGQPGCMLVSGSSVEPVRETTEALSSNLLRLYCGEDLLGTEVGAAAKNVIGIAAGMLDGLGVPSLKGALMTRGPYEIARLVRRMGGHEQTVYGLSHLGDYEATLFSHYSHNRACGEALAHGQRYNLLAEGVDTASAIMLLSRSYEVDLPICTAVYHVLKGIITPTEALDGLFERPGRYEFT